MYSVSYTHLDVYKRQAYVNVKNNVCSKITVKLINSDIKIVLSECNITQIISFQDTVSNTDVSG